MPFQIEALPPSLFTRFFAMSDAALAQHDARRMVVTTFPGTPCRVSMADAEVRETVLLLNYEHQPARSPFRSSHAVYVREGAEMARPAAGEVPEVLISRLVSVRQFDRDDMMIDADVVPGSGLKEAIKQAFCNPQVGYIHLHYAKPGCFAARVSRV